MLCARSFWCWPCTERVGSLGILHEPGLKRRWWRAPLTPAFTRALSTLHTLTLALCRCVCGSRRDTPRQKTIPRQQGHPQVWGRLPEVVVFYHEGWVGKEQRHKGRSHSYGKRQGHGSQGSERPGKKAGASSGDLKCIHEGLGLGSGSPEHRRCLRQG